MKTIVLISCTKEKQDRKCKAEDLYISPLFRKNLSYAKSLDPDHIFILSGKYGLLPLTKEIAPYNVSLHDISNEELKEWAESTLRQLQQEADTEIDEFIFLADEVYRKFLIPGLKYYLIPLELPADDLI